ncbi:MAG: hypothetical protein NTU89_04000 [Candidatus Dependentiae bacterium]|nr:hypothetical protein [Candidatus Dependentiae bacterium]
MKKIFLKLIFICTIISVFCSRIYLMANDSIKLLKNQEFFVNGNNHFLHGNFAMARESYLKINEKSSVVWQNIGNCFFNEKNYAQALICWKRSEYGASWKQLGDIFRSEEKALIELRLPVPSIWHDVLKKILILMPKMLIQFLLFLMLILFLSFFYRCWSMSFLYIVVSCNYKVAWFLMLGIIGCSILWFGKEQVFKERTAIVIHEKVVAYAGPETSFHQLFQLPLGATVHIVSNCLPKDQKSLDQNMHKLSYNGQLGWVKSGSVEIV